MTEISLPALIRKLVATGVELPEGNGSELDVLEAVYQLAQAGNERVLEVLNAVGRQIGQGAAPLVESFNPSQVIFGGRMGKLIKLVESDVRSALLEQTLPYMAEDLEVVVNASDDDSLLGGLATVFDATMTNPIRDL